MKPILVLAIAATANAESLKTADLGKLRDHAQRNAEVSRLADCDGVKRTLTGYRFLTANQKDGRPPLHVLCAGYDYAALSNNLDGYKVEKPEELFGNLANPVASGLEATLDPIIDSVLLVFDSQGNEIRPFGGNNYTDEGYYFDFNRDGILDRADATNYGVKEAPKHSIQVFELQTFEPEPRTLLEVIYNWHPDSASEGNEWTFSCHDDDQDGFVEISFGPANATSVEDRRRIVFRWDSAAQRYSTGELPESSHVRVMMPGETLSAIAKSGGLGYPLIGNASDRETDEETPPSTQAPYVFRSLKGLPDAELAAFFQGKPRRSHWDGPDGSFPNRLPDGLWNMTPKQAAVAIAEANRMPGHRDRWQLALDDRNGTAPPASGWLLHNWGSSGCYSYSSHLLALRFGVQDPSLTVFEYNSIGVVGRNPWADQPAHNVRVIHLAAREARFLADTVFWLDRIRAFSTRRDDRSEFSGGSTADGFATVSLIPDGSAPRTLAGGTVWATSTISANWQSDYDQEVFINLAEFLLGAELPKMLGDRWNVAPEIGHHSLTTSTKERLAPRVDRDARQQLSETFSAILEGHEKDPVPAHALQALALAAGDEALVELLPALQKLSAALPPEAEEDREFAALEKRFAQDHFGNPLADEPEEHKKAYARLQELRDKREFLPSAILRKPLSGTIARLRLVEKPSDLMNAAANDPARSNWALTQLRRVDPEAWSVIVASQFRDADTQSRRVIFGTLAAGNSDAAKRVVAGIDSAERLELIIEIARFHRRNDKASLAGDLPVLMTLVRDSAQDYIRRGEAMEILSEADLPPAMLEDLVSLLADEIGNPQKGQYGMSTLNHAVLALARISQSTEHLERIMSTPQVVKEAFNAGFEAILRMTGDREDRKQLLADFIRPRFSESDGMMNDLFLKALTHDLRELAPEIAAFASESPAVPDGDAANYSGGRFKTPIGQRYHIAREITALWSEGDPITVSRMWPFFIAAHASSFDPERGDPSLRELAAKQIRNLAADQRRKAIKTAVTLIPIPAYASASESWLRELASD